MNSQAFERLRQTNRIVTTNSNDELIDAIVAGVLDRLRGPSAPSSSTTDATQTALATVKELPSESELVVLSERVITEAVLEEKLNGASVVQFAPKTVLTPTARDFLRVNKITWSYSRSGGKAQRHNEAPQWAVIIVHAAHIVDRVVTDLMPGTRRELLGCPDDAANLAIAEIARGGFAKAIIFAEQTHRAACLANRHESVKAVAVRDAADALSIRKQLRANVWCVDPTNRGYFEVRNLVKAII